MKILADMHISPVTIECLRGCGYDAIRVSEVLPPTALDAEIVATAVHQDRVVLTQDLDYSDLVALSGRRKPSIITLRLVSSDVANVNRLLVEVLPLLEDDVVSGVLVTITDERIRRHRLPVSE